MFSRIATSALFAGAAAGLIAGVLQLVFVQPVLLHAELYETGQLIHFGGQATSTEGPGFSLDPLRDGLSIIFTMAIYTGYAFLLLATVALADERGHIVTARNGLIWGGAGYIAAHLAPAFSLAPEVPGVAAADVYARQIWWFFTITTAAVSMWLLAFQKGWALWGLACVLLIAPHIIGAPQPDKLTGPVPPEIAALFVSRSLGVGLVAWMLLGMFAGHFWNKEAEA